MLIGDGGTATALQAKGLPIGEAPEPWTLSHPEVVATVAWEYRDAGADFVLTNTFGANRFRLARVGLERDVSELNRAAVGLARTGAGAAESSDGLRVYGSVGPTGLSPDELESSRPKVVRAFEEQVQALSLAGVDALVIETSVSTTEALIALTACRTMNVETIVSFAFRVEEDGAKTLVGELLADGVREVRDAGAIAVGVNCVSAREIAEVIGAFPGDIPIWLKPNAGLPEPSNEGLDYPDRDEEIVEVLHGFARSEVRYVGGCCGTGPAFIRRLRTALKDQ